MSSGDGEPSAIRRSSTPELTFVIPARNEAAMIDSALRSVAAQEGGTAALEVVVVDNGSHDATSAVARSFAASHPEMRMKIVAEPRIGRSAAKNAGASAATGRILVFLDADSQASPGLARAVEQRHRSGWRAGAIAVVASSTDWLDRKYFDLISLGPRLFGIRAQLFFCERDLFFSAGEFDERLQLAEDREVLDRIRASGANVCYVDEAWISTSPRRLHALPLRFGVATMFTRWLLANFGVGRDWPY